MRLSPIPALLLAAALAPPLAAQVPDALRTAPRVQGTGNGSTIIVWPRHVQSLQARLDSFAVALPAAERALWNDVLLRAAHVPAPAAAEVRVTPVLQIGPGGGCEDTPGMDGAAGRAAIIVQGGRAAGASGIIVQGGRTPRAGIVVQGGRTPAAQGANAPRPAPNATVAIGPKQDDPAPPPQSLGRRLADLSLRLTAEERGALDWLLTRAAEPSGPDGGLPPRTPGDPRPGERVSLRQALGIDPLAIGPKQDDPAPRPDSQRWILRF
ncbi:hypothetical protein [Longimicrobium sp.]|uniref:hypothetical protein n=1 Tax=Longimicrobium sp. TaxID=2029185 RepID=UPI003B3A3255